jgi:hypothetical protein
MGTMYYEEIKNNSGLLRVKILYVSGTTLAAGSPPAGLRAEANVKGARKAGD